MEIIYDTTIYIYIYIVKWKWLIAENGNLFMIHHIYVAWQTINEVSRRKSTAEAKLKAANKQERIKLRKQHFENLLGNPPKVTHEPITRIISKQLDHSHKKNSTRFSEKLKIGKLQGWTRFPQKYGRPNNSTTYCSDTATQYIIKIRLIDGWRDASPLP